MIGPAEIYSDSRGVVQALNEGEAECISANHKDADLWIQVWDKEQDLRLRVAWVKAPTSAKEKARLTQQKKQIAMANDGTDEHADGGATVDGSCFAGTGGERSGYDSQANICCNEIFGDLSL